MVWLVSSLWKFQKEKVHFKYLDDALDEKQSVACWTIHALHGYSYDYDVEWQNNLI